MTTMPAGLRNDGPTRPRFSLPIDGLLLQVAHRLGAVGLLAIVGAVATLYRQHDPSVAVAVAAASTVVGLSAALMARSQSPRLGTALVVAATGLAAAAVLIEGSHSASAVGAALLGLAACGALFAWTSEPPDRAPSREAMAVLVFNLVLAAVAFTLILSGRTDQIRDGVQAFLSPTPPLPPQ